MRESLEDVVGEGDYRASLLAIRDYLAHELEVNRCNTCMASKLRTGDQAALVLRLTDTLEKIRELPNVNGEVSELERLRQRKAARTPNATAPPRPPQRGVTGN